MLIVHVFFDVKGEYIEAFRAASIQNAAGSLQESGVVSFDILQEQEDSSKFLFMEVYKSPEDQANHRETIHYKKWRETIIDMLVKPYSFIKYKNMFPQQF